MASPAEVAASFFSSEVGGATGWVVKFGKQVPTPDKTITMFDTGGQPPNPKWAVDFVTIQALVRAGPNEYGVCWTKARAVRDALLGIDSVTVGSDRWVSVVCQGDVGFVGYDDRERPTCSVNFRVIIEPGSVGNREAL